MPSHYGQPYKVYTADYLLSLSERQSLNIPQQTADYEPVAPLSQEEVPVSDFERPSIIEQAIANVKRRYAIIRKRQQLSNKMRVRESFGDFKPLEDRIKLFEIVNDLYLSFQENEQRRNDVS